MSMGPGLDAYLERPGIENGETVSAPLVDCTPVATTNTEHGTVNETLANGFVEPSTGACIDQNGFAENINDVSNAGTLATTNFGVSGAGVVTSAAGATGSGIIAPNSEGEVVTLPSGVTGTSSLVTSPVAGPFYVGQVSSTGPAAYSGDNTSATDNAFNDQYPTASFQLVDSAGNPVTVTGTGVPGTIALQIGATTTNSGIDPLYDAFDPTSGGGDTGAILLSPYIKGGTVSNDYYNHYSLLRSLEDIFDVSAGSSTATGYTGTIPINTGVDGDGHLGYAGQPGLAPFGSDVFTNLPATPPTTVTHTTTVTNTATVTNTTTVTSTRTVTNTRAVVPYVVGDTLAQAKSAIGASGLKVGKVTTKKGKGKGKDLVSAASPKAGTRLNAGASVALTVAPSK